MTSSRWTRRRPCGTQLLLRFQLCPAGTGAQCCATQWERASRPGHTCGQWACVVLVVVGRLWAASATSSRGVVSLGSSFATVLSPRARNLESSTVPANKKQAQCQAPQPRGSLCPQCPQGAVSNSPTVNLHLCMLSHRHSLAGVHRFSCIFAAASSSFLTTVFKTPSGFNRKFTWETLSFHLFTTPHHRQNINHNGCLPCRQGALLRQASPAY